MKGDRLTSPLDSVPSPAAECERHTLRRGESRCKVRHPIDKQISFPQNTLNDVVSVLPSWCKT